VVDVGAEWEGMAEPWDVVKDIIFDFLFFLLFLVVLVLTNDSNHIHTWHFGTDSRLADTAKQDIRINPQRAHNTRRPTIALAEPP
jgi:hypothetical protein